MDPMIYIVAGIVSVILIVYLVIRHEKKRREGLHDKAQTLGFSFIQKARLDRIGKAGEFHLFNVGHSKRIRNMMERDQNGIQNSIYDYWYTTGGGNTSHTFVQTVFQFHSERLKLPAFILRPEHVFIKIAKTFGYKDINFEAFPEFSAKYLLKGEDEEAIRKLFNQDVILRLENENKMFIEGLGSFLICYRSSKRVRPEDLWMTYESMHSLCEMFIRQCE